MNLIILIVYFFYGLVFFIMGVTITLEVGRFPALGEARVLRPLAVFGFAHGLHEWVELILLLGYGEEPTMYSWWSLGRLALLALSFASLIAYGVQILRPPRGLAAADAYVGGGMLVLYVVVVLFAQAILLPNPADMVWIADALARYILAVPGSLLAVFGLHQQVVQARQNHRHQLGHSLRWAILGFALYGGSQIFVPQAPFLPAAIVNAAVFSRLVGVPIQVVRTIAAVVFTLALIRAIQVVEKERQQQLAAAQQARLEALQQVQDELVKREELRQELLRRIVIAQEEERARIARELHDELAQLLTSFTLDVATLKTHVGDDPACAEILPRLQDHGRQISKRLYRLVHDLRPAQLDDLGLVAAVQHLVAEARRNFGLQVSLEVEGSPRRLDPLVETVCYRVTQEALTNIARYAQTDQAEVSFAFREQAVEMNIRDQGVGFSPDAQGESAWRFGIAGMQERVRSVGGDFHLSSTPGEGTRIRVIIPDIKRSTE